MTDELILPTSKRDIALLIKIIQNILNNPQKEQYRNINLKRILNRFKETALCIYVLYNVGFSKSKDGARLIYHQKQLDKLSELYKTLSIYAECAHSPNSKYLLSCNCYVDTAALDTNRCSVDSCPFINIIANILKLYKRHIQIGINNVYKDIYCKIGDQYNGPDLLNDHNHVLLCHSGEFESVYNKLCAMVYDHQSCDLSQCNAMIRNQRNRVNDVECKNCDNNKEDAVGQQLLDRMHCYYFHSFDTGYKMTENLVNNICDTDIKNHDNVDCDEVVLAINNIVESQQNVYKNMAGLQRLNASNNKFSSNELDKYHYGHRFYYWEHYKNNQQIHDDAFCHSESIQKQYGWLGEWYIVNKYNTLKEELLCNAICCIPHIAWIQTMEKAKIHIKTKKVKQRQCPRMQSAELYEMKYKDPMHQKHLVAMMIYCNYDTLQKIFSETYRKLNVNESDESLKQRHSHYYHIGRLLRECVECFGTHFKEINSGHITLFHGVNRKFVFDSMFATINVPFSTTSDFAVATNFCANEGMILELFIDASGWSYKLDEGVDAMLRLNMFDCRWVSDFSNESEIFCIGGLGSFKITTIIERSGINYCKYIAGIRHMTHGMGSTPNAVDDILGEWELDQKGKCITHRATTKSELQMVYRLISHELHRYVPDHPLAFEFKSCPEYIRNILHLHCCNIKKISFYNIRSKIHDMFFRKNNGWIKLKEVTTIYPNVREIIFVATGSHPVTFITKSSIILDVLEFVKIAHKTELKVIEIIVNAEFEEEIWKYVEKYQFEFNKYLWFIETLINEPYTMDQMGPNHIILTEQAQCILKNEIFKEHADRSLNAVGIGKRCRLIFQTRW